jgi:hypothetical protein
MVPPICPHSPVMRSNSDSGRYGVGAAPSFPVRMPPRATIKRPSEGDEMAALLLVVSLAMSATSGANERPRRRCAARVAVAVRYARLAMAVIEIAIIV